MYVIKLNQMFTALRDHKEMQAKYLLCTWKLLYLSINYKIAWALRRNIQRHSEPETTGRPYRKKKKYIYIYVPYSDFPSYPCKDCWQCSLICFKLERTMNTTLVNYNTCNALAVSVPCINKVYTKQFYFFRDRDIYKLLSYKMRLRLLNDPGRHILLQNEIHNS